MAKTPDELLRELESAGVVEKASSISGPRRGRSAAHPRRGRVTVYVIALLIAMLGASPIGQVALYPVSLFVTLVHETCHAIAAAATGGSVVSLRVSRDLSGLTETGGGVVPAIASAGYVGASLVGAVLISLPRRVARAALLGLALVPVADLAFFHPADLFTFAACAGFCAVLVLTALFLPGSWVVPVQLFLGVEMALNAARDVLTALLITGSGAHVQTDAGLMSSALFFRPVVWAAAWTALSALVLALAIWIAIRRALYSP